MPLPLHDTNEYIQEVLSYVRLRRDHKRIWRELLGHFEDSREQGKAEGLTEEAAEKRSIERMGDPVALGKALDREHDFRLGAAVAVLRILLILVCIRFSLSALSELPLAHDTSAQPRVYAPQSEIATPQTVKIDAVTVEFERLVVDGRNNGWLYYTAYMLNPFEMDPEPIFWSMADDLGNQYEIDMLPIRKAGWCSGALRIHHLDSKASRLYLIFDRNGRHFQVDIPLKGEGI